MNKNNRCIISGVHISMLPSGYNEESRECKEIKTNLLNMIVQLHINGVDEFYVDCEYGFPLWGGEIVIGLMKYNDIRLYVVYPFENQPYRFDVSWQDRFFRVHEKCTDVIYIYHEYDVDGNRTFSRESDDFLMEKAADYMLSDCGRLLFYGDGQGDYIYEEAVKMGHMITTIKTEEDKLCGEQG